MESLHAQTTTLASHTNALQNQTTALQSQTNTLQSQTATLHAQSAALQTMSTGLQNTVSALQQQIASLQAQNDALRVQAGRSEDRMRGLERSYRDVLGEMVNFQKNTAQQDAFMQGLIQYFLGMEGGESVVCRVSFFFPPPPLFFFFFTVRSLPTPYPSQPAFVLVDGRAHVPRGL